MNGLVLILLALLGLMLIGIQVIVARGWHSYLDTEPDDVETTRRIKRIAQWVFGSGFALWAVALVVLPNKFDVALTGGATLLLLGGLLALQVLGRVGAINQKTYVVARVALVPLIVGIAIAVSKVFR